MVKKKKKRKKEFEDYLNYRLDRFRDWTHRMRRSLR